MSSPYLRRLPIEEKESLRLRLYELQGSKCFICNENILRPFEAVDIDHIEPTSEGGKDDHQNFALAHEHCNRSKQARDLRVARVLARFDKIAARLEKENRSPNLGDILDEYGGGKYHLPIEIDGSSLTTQFPEIGEQEPLTSHVFEDKLSGFSSSFLDIPIEYLHHDDQINPRAIGSNLQKLVVEFHKKLPQLHVSLGWVETSGELSPKIRLFDGQHKAAAQILLGAKRLPVRVFINPNKDVLLTANTNAGTTLRQIAFDKSVQRSLGSSILSDRIDRFRQDRNLEGGDMSFSEQDLVNHFSVEARAMRRYVVDRVRYGITNHADNRLREYIELGGRSTRRPLSYSTIEKTFYRFLIYDKMLSTPFSDRYEEGLNPRQLEIEQIVKLMNIIADKIYIDQFDFELGNARIESDVEKGKDIPESHLRASRISKEEIVHNLARLIRQVMYQYFVNIGTPLNEDKLFHNLIPEQCWDNVKRFLDAFVKLSVWVNRALPMSIFGRKNPNGFWESIFKTGNTPDGIRVLSEGLNLIKMIQR